MNRDNEVGALDLISLGNHVVEIEMGRPLSEEADDEAPLTVTALALGQRAFARADALNEFIAANIGRTVDLQVVQSHLVTQDPPEPVREEATRGRLDERLAASHLVVVIAESGEPWVQVITRDSLLAAADPGTIIYLDLGRSQAELEQFIATSHNWFPVLSASGQQSAGLGACAHEDQGRLLIGVPEALIAAIECPGAIGVDYADFREAFGRRPWIAAYGCASFRGEGRSRQAAERALESLELKQPVDRSMAVALIVVVQPANGDLQEVEQSLSVASHRLPGDATIVVAAPVGADDRLEVAILAGLRLGCHTG